MPTSAGNLLPWDEWPHQRIKINEGLSIHLRYAGTGPPLILLSWHTVGPILAQDFTVIAPDNRGASNSNIPRDDNYAAEAHADDLNAIVEFFGLDSVYVFSHDKGSGFAAAFAAKYPEKIRRVRVSEYALPGFGYQHAWVPDSGDGWDLYQNWQLGFFSVPEAASYFISGREKEMLTWYFFHASYSGNEVISQDHLQRYAASIAKPGFLRAMLNVFSVTTVTKDTAFFKSKLGEKPLSMPVLALGGEASVNTEILKLAWGPVAENVVIEAIPKAGHWIADENPAWLAKRIKRFFSEDATPLPHAHLAWLEDKVTL